MRRIELVAVAFVMAALGCALQSAHAEGLDGRFSLFFDWTERELSDLDDSRDESRIMASVSLESTAGDAGGMTFAVNGRFATFPSSEGRDDRSSLYEAWVGYDSPEQQWSLRLGQLRLPELGALGTVGGAVVEYRVRKPTPLGRVRVAAFAGLEPKILEIDYVDDVEKAGAYVAIEGDQGRRHVLGWTQIQNHDMTERSVLIFNNFLNVDRKLFVYQAMEYDLQAPGGLGSSDLTYFFANVRQRFSPAIWLQATYHYGRSIDTRRIADDVFLGRPVPSEVLDGLLHESRRARLTVRPHKRVRLWAAYGRDRNNRGDDWYDRTRVGFFVTRFVGFDLSGSWAWIDRSSGSYETTFASLGRSFGRRVYVSLDFVSSLSVFRFEGADGGTIEARPESDRFSLNANITLSKRFAAVITAEHTDHTTYEELRVLTGLILRF